MSIPACPRLSTRQSLSCCHRRRPRPPENRDDHPTCDASRFGGPSSIRRADRVGPDLDAPCTATCTWGRVGERAGGHGLLAGTHCKPACTADTACPVAHAGEEALHTNGRRRCAGRTAPARTSGKGEEAGGGRNRRRTCSGLVGRGGRRARGRHRRGVVAGRASIAGSENTAMKTITCENATTIHPLHGLDGCGRRGSRRQPPMPPQFPESA